MSKLKRIAKSVHAVSCTFEMDGNRIIYHCEEDCDITKNGGIDVVYKAEDAIAKKEETRRRHQRRKKTRGW